jgi:hypothetical protein
MILAITNEVRPACLAQMRATEGRDGAEQGGLVVARLVSAPSRPYPTFLLTLERLFICAAPGPARWTDQAAALKSLVSGKNV